MGMQPCPKHGMDHGIADPECVACKQALGPLYKHQTAKRLLPVITFDYSGPHVSSVTDDKYALIVVWAYDKTRLVWAFPVESPDGQTTVSCLQVVMEELRTITGGSRPPVLRAHSDRAAAFLGKDVKQFLQAHNIRQTTNSGHDPKANGLAERWVGLIKARATATLIHAKMGPDFWPFACRYVAMMHNARVMETEKMSSPAFGEAVVYNKQVDKPDAFTGRGEVGVFLGWNHNISHGANVLVEVDGEWDTVKTAKIRELKTKQVWRLVRDDDDPRKTVYVSQYGDVVWTPPMNELTTVEEYEFKGPYVEYQIKKLSPGWAWWYQSLGEVLPEVEAINLTKAEQEISIGEANLENLKELDLGPGTSVERKRPFPE
eukprot:4306905-Amphidinium_carterae.1